MLVSWSLDLGVTWMAFKLSASQHMEIWSVQLVELTVGKQEANSESASAEERFCCPQGRKKDGCVAACLIFAGVVAHLSANSELT